MKTSLNIMNLVTIFLILLFGVGASHCSTSFMFCTEQVHVTIIWQPDLRTTQNEWLKFFGLLLGDFNHDQCFEINIYDPVTQRAIPLTEFERVVEQFDGGRQIDVQSPFHPTMFRFETETNNETNTPFLTEHYKFIKDLPPSNKEEKAILLYIHGRNLEDSVSDALKNLQVGPQNYDVICLTYLEYPLKLEWLPLNRLLWYHHSLLLEQRNNIKNLLRNSDYDHAPVLAKLFENSVNTTCLFKEEKITVWALDSMFEKVDFMKLIELLSILRTILVNEDIVLDIKIIHDSIDERETDFYDWVCRKRNITYQGGRNALKKNFNSHDRLDSIDFIQTELLTFLYDEFHVIEKIRFLRNFNVVEIGVTYKELNPQFGGYDNVIASSNDLINSNDFLALFFQRFNEVACYYF